MTHFSSKTSFIILFFLLLTVISGLISISTSLLLGLFYALFIGNPFLLHTQKWSGLILKLSIVIMGLGLNIDEVVKTSQDSFLLTLLTISLALLLGLLLGKIFKVDSKLSFLIAGGTAICGGSAIAALAPAIQAKPSDLIVSISIVFLLNAIGLLVYPVIGHYLSMSQADFGLWAALGIHDTSSVVGAAASYGEESLKIATTTKLARALWIIPLVFIASFYFNNKQSSTKFPIFILFFVIASLLTTFIPMLHSVSLLAPLIAKKGMAISLFLIGTGFTKDILKEINFNSMWQAITLWILVSVSSFWLIKIL